MVYVDTFHGYGMGRGLGSTPVQLLLFGVISISMGIVVGIAARSSSSPEKRPRPGNPRPGIDSRGSICIRYTLLACSDTHSGHIDSAMATLACGDA